MAKRGKQQPDQGAAEYGASSFQVLEGLDAVRKRPGMYIGSTDSRGLQHCMWEIIDNAVDEAIAGFCRRIAITLHADGSVEVSDDGRGIPVDIEPKTGLSGVRVVFEKLHAGGKFGGGAYGASGGLHGVGASVVNALSARLDVEVRRAGSTYALSFDHGISGHFSEDGAFLASGELRVTAGAQGTGTTVRYWADRKIFLPGAEIDLERTYQRARQTAFMVPGLAIAVRDERSDDLTEEVFCFEGGVRDFVNYLAQGRGLSDTLVLKGDATFTETVPVIENDKMVTRDVERLCAVEIGLRWGVGYDTDLRSFVNIVETPKGGTHVAGFERSLVRTVNDALKAAKVLKANDEAVIKEDALEGLTAIILVRLAEPQYEGQTKETLGTAAVSSIVAQVVSEQLKTYFTDPRRRAQTKAVLEKIAQAARTRKAARLHKETIRRKNALESSALPAKLADCRSEDLERTELFIIEGDSAGGTLKLARDSEFQALLPIRGKILNTMKASEKQMLDNAECAAIITAMGAGSGPSFDASSIRYGKLIVTADADVDGSHIRCLLLTLCWRYMRPLLEQGRVYAAMPPLFRVEVTGGREHHYCYTEAERDAVLAQLESEGKKVREIQRYKGLGEMDADQLAETTIDVSKRKLRRMTVEDALAAEEAFELCMGADVGNRKQFITEFGGMLAPDRIDA